jgi:2-iminobutanoate/2-iminopropanoate deaminase
MTQRKVLNSAQVKRPVGWSSQGWLIAGTGRTIFSSGLTSRDNSTGEVMHAGDPAAQTAQTLENLKLVLAEAGATLADVVKITTFICDRAHFQAVMDVRRHYFPKDPPASSTVIVSGLSDPRLLVEIEAIAFVPA